MRSVCRESEIIVPFELVHLPGSGSVPSWLTNSALAPFVGDAVQLEHVLRVVACSAAHRFLLAGANRHGTSLASLAACYFFRMVRGCIRFPATRLLHLHTLRYVSVLRGDLQPLAHSTSQHVSL